MDSRSPLRTTWVNSIFYTLPTAGVHVIAVAAYAHLPTGSNNRLLGVGSCPPASSAMDISGPTWVSTPLQVAASSLTSQWAYRTRPSDRLPHPSSYDPVGEHRENAKLYRYRKLSGIDADDPEQFVPFAMDATGHLGARASAFLGRALAESSCAGARTEFETQLGAAMARFNALASLVRDASHL